MRLKVHHITVEGPSITLWPNWLPRQKFDGEAYKVIKLSAYGANEFHLIHFRGFRSQPNDYHKCMKRDLLTQK